MPKIIVLVSLYGMLIVHGIIYQVYMRRFRSWKERPRYEISPLVRMFRLALWLIYVIAIIDMPLALYGQDIVPDAWAYSIGMAIDFIALILLAWSLHSLGENFSDCNDGRLPMTLVRHGPYRYLSHPIYVSNVLLLLGFLVMIFNPIMLGVTLFTGFFYIISARDESRALRAKFGAGK